MAPLGSKDTASSGSLPPVTAVFCSVEGAKQYSARTKIDAHMVHSELVSVMKGALAQVPGGYLVRHVEGEFRYFAVFEAPQVWAQALSIAPEIIMMTVLFFL